MPSPVETAGLVVCEKTCPSPPEASTTARQRTAPTPSRWPSPITCRVIPATPPSAASSRSTARACSTTSMSGAAWIAATSARWISAPVASPPACAIRSRWWPPSRVSESTPSRGVVEVGAERDQLADRLRALVDQDPHRLRVAGSGAGHEGVALVLVGGVPGPERGGDPALRPLGRAGREHVLGDDEDLVDLVAQPQRGGQAGDARSRPRRRRRWWSSRAHRRSGGREARPGEMSFREAIDRRRDRTERSCAGLRAPGRCRAAPRRGPSRCRRSCCRRRRRPRSAGTPSPRRSPSARRRSG